MVQLAGLSCGTHTALDGIKTIGILQHPTDFKASLSFCHLLTLIC
jgi:hypothetical protein